MKKVVIALLIIFCFVLQVSVFPHISFGGVVPNLLILLTSAFGFMDGKRTGIMVGFCCGLICDIFFGEVLGFYALIYMYIGYTNGMFKSIFYPEEIKLPIFLITCSDIFYCLIIYLLLFLLRSRFAFGHYFIHTILPEVVYTVISTIVFYPIILWLNQRIEAFEKRSA